MALDVSSWVKDGTASTPPVTESTPTTETPTTETPTTETATPPAIEGSSEGPTRGPDGKFTSAAAGAAATTEEQIEDAIEALRDGKPYKIPKNVQFPWKRGNESGTASIEEIAKSPFFEKDYRIKTAETAEMRRAVEAEKQQVRAMLARAQAREKFLQEQEARFREAQADPEKWEKYERHLEMIQKSPEYRKTYEDALAKREADAELRTVRESQETSAVQEAQAAVIEAIERFAGDFPDADPERVRVAYADALMQGRLPLSEAALRQVFQQEAEHAGRLKEKLRATELTPIQSELADLRAQLAEFKKAKAAEEKNALVRDKIDKSKTPGAPVGGSPPAPKPKVTTPPKPGETLEERSRKWGRGEL